VRQVRRSTSVVTLVVAGLSAMVAVQYRRTFADAFDVRSLAALAENPAIRTLFGTPVALDDPGGFTVWRTGTFAAVLVGGWALLVATRITRGEEDAGRWALLLAGPLRLRSAVRRHLLVVAAASLLVGAALAGAMVLAGTDPAGSVVYGLSVGLVGVFFAGLGVVTAQLVADRRVAAGLAVGVLVAALLLRMVGDGVDRLRWVMWLSRSGCSPRRGRMRTTGWRR
jgi:ABC-2 type transport system permease protein